MRVLWVALEYIIAAGAWLVMLFTSPLHGWDVARDFAQDVLGRHAVPRGDASQASRGEKHQVVKGHRERGRS